MPYKEAKIFYVIVAPYAIQVKLDKVIDTINKEPKKFSWKLLPIWQELPDIFYLDISQRVSICCRLFEILRGHLDGRFISFFRSNRLIGLRTFERTKQR